MTNISSIGLELCVSLGLGPCSGPTKVRVFLDNMKLC